MSTTQEELLELVRLLVDEPEAVDLDEIDAGGTTLFELRVADPDVGKVIGRQGRTARALRALLAARGDLEGRRYELEIVED